MTAGQLLFEDFKDRLGSVFTPSEAEYSAFPLTLDEAELLPSNVSIPGMRPPFSLIFLGADARVLPQRLYQLTHEAMGELAIFLVPVGQDARGISYQAVFN
jgi:hypothetical protein